MTATLRTSICITLALASCAKDPAPPATARTSPTASDDSIPDVIDRSLPGVVLLLNWLADGKLGFGAGIILDNHGLVLTNLHVVANAKSLGAMLYKPGRVSYIPVDGGLARYIFENHRDILPAVLVKGDPILDLAIVHVDANTSSLKRLPFRSQAVRPGERVLSLGHPGQTVWSFTSGIVSAIHQAAIQHDAPITQGNSGGPLIDSQGRIVGVNTRKLSDTGFGFARPIGMAQLLIDGTTAPFQPDQSTVEKAFTTCARALELHSPSVLNCADWDRLYEVMLQSMKQIRSKLKLSDKFAKILEQKVKEMEKEQWLEMFKNASLAELKGEDPTKLIDEFAQRVSRIPVITEPGDVEEAQRERAQAIAGLGNKLTDSSEFKPQYDRALLKRFGLKQDPRNPRAQDELMKLGIRLEEVQQIDPEHAWLLVSGRNHDGSFYRYSEYWGKLAGGWTKREPPFPSELAMLPKGWPPVLKDYETELRIFTRQFERGLKHSTRLP